MTQDSSTATPEAADLEVLLTEISDPQLPVRGRIVCPGVLIAGRTPTVHLVLPESDRHAARVHFLIELSPAFCRLTNQSQHGTFVNGMIVHTQCDLQHGDLIRAGKSVFTVEVLR